MAMKPLEKRSINGLLRLQKETMKRANDVLEECRAIEKELNARGWYAHYSLDGSKWKEGKPEERKPSPRYAGRINL